MTTVNVSNQWHLRDNEVQLLVDSGVPSKINWWLKNMTTNQFVNYDKQIGGRIRGDQPFQATLDLEYGEYMGATGDYKITTPEGRHCSQVFYFYVDENGAHVCKKSELPSQGGSGAPVQTPVTNWGTTTGVSTSSWGNAPAKPIEYFIIPNYKACMNDMAVRPGFEGCDDCDMIDMNGSLDCTNCRHALDVYVKKA